MERGHRQGTTQMAGSVILGTEVVCRRDSQGEAGVGSEKGPLGRGRVHPEQGGAEPGSGWRPQRWGTQLCQDLGLK